MKIHKLDGTTPFERMMTYVDENGKRTRQKYKLKELREIWKTPEFKAFAALYPKAEPVPSAVTGDAGAIASEGEKPERAQQAGDSTAQPADSQSRS